MPATMKDADLSAAVRELSGFVNGRNATTLLERCRALVAAGEPEERILARLNGPARTGPTTDDATPSRADAGMSALERQQRMEQARRTTVAELADAVADRVVRHLGEREDRLDSALRIGLERLAIQPLNADVVMGGTVVEQAVAGNVSAVAAANASASTTHDDTVPWETRVAATTLPTRSSQRETLGHLRGNATVLEVAASLGIQQGTAHARLVALHANGHVQRRLVNGRYVYRVHPAIRDQVFPAEGATGAALVREVVAMQRDSQARA